MINYPNEYAYTRVTEFKYLTGQEHPKTSIVYEFPQAEGDPYYPVPRPENLQLYTQYQALAEKTPGVHFVGRLATYKYYNMDQVWRRRSPTTARCSSARRSSSRRHDAVLVTGGLGYVAGSSPHNSTPRLHASARSSRWCGDGWAAEPTRQSRRKVLYSYCVKRGNAGLMSADTVCASTCGEYLRVRIGFPSSAPPRPAGGCQAQT